MKSNNHTLKRVVACAMIVIMAVTAVPLSGFVGLELPEWSQMLATKASAAETYTEGFFKYTVSDGQATITGCDTSVSGALVIPATLGGYPVKSIGHGGFFYCDGLTSITIPDSVTNIGDLAFQYCSGLTSVTIPDSVTSIGEEAFYRCTGLTSITIPDSVTSIGKRAFEYCSGLASITVPDSVTSIGPYAFANTAWYNKQPNGNVYAGKVYYEYKHTMPDNTSVVIKKGTKGIAGAAFSNCCGLASITIPDSVTNIGEEAFKYCTGLTSVTIPGSVTSIGSGTFQYCTGLTSVTIPDSVTSIGDEAFNGCIGLTSVTIGNSVTSIGDEAFNGCIGLTSVTIPNSVTNIGDGAFNGCTNLKDVYYAGSLEQLNTILNSSGNEPLLNANIHCNHKHSYSSTVTKKGTCTESGVKTYTCSVCGDSYTEVIPATGTHDSNKVAISKATFSADGKIVKSCSGCGKKMSETALSRIGSVTLAATKYTYDGKAKTPAVTVKNKAGKVISASNYTVTYKNNKNVGTAFVIVTFKGSYYTGSKTLNFSILPGVTSKIATATNSSAIKLAWKAVPGATGYRVFQYDAKTKKYVTVKTLTGTSYTVSKLKSGTTYKFAVRAYSTVNGTVYWASGYKTVTATTNPGTPTLTVTAGTKKAVLKWSKRAEATGYVVYMATSQNGKYTKIATIKNNGTVSMTKTGLTTGKTYYFKVAAYTTSGGSNIYSAWSSVRGVKIK